MEQRKFPKPAKRGRAIPEKVSKTSAVFFER
jgi:hypothetical protein